MIRNTSLEFTLAELHQLYSRSGETFICSALADSRTGTLPSNILVFESEYDVLNAFHKQLHEFCAIYGYGEYDPTKEFNTDWDTLEDLISEYKFDITNKFDMTNNRREFRHSVFERMISMYGPDKTIKITETIDYS